MSSMSGYQELENSPAKQCDYEVKVDGKIYRCMSWESKHWPDHIYVDKHIRIEWVAD